MFLFPSSHLVWKEYRTQRSLWLAIVAMAVLLACLLQWIRLVSPSLDMQPAGFSFFALAFPPIFAWAAACMLFAGEHEQETFPFLSAQPVPARDVFLAKLVSIVAGVLLLIPPLGLLDLWLSAGQPVYGASLARYAWLNMGLTSLELSAWSILFSLLLHRVIHALLAAAAAESAMVITLFVIHDTFFSGVHQYSDAPIVGTLLPRFLVSLLVFGGAFYLGRTWFDEPRWGRGGVADAISGSWIVRWHPESRGMAQLLWQSVRQSAWMLMVTAVLTLLLGFWVRRSLILPPTQPPGWHVTLAYLLIPISGLAGLLAFLPDQAARRYPYFAEHAVGPGRIWVSRQLTALLLPLGWLLLALLVGVMNVSAESSWWPTGHRPASLSPVQQVLWDLSGIFWASLLLYSVGQTVSLFVRSPVLAVAIGLFLGAVLFVAHVLLLHLCVPGSIWSFPLSMALLAVTRRSIRPWVEQVQTWPERFRKGALVGIPLLIVVAAISVYRVYEIPQVTHLMPALSRLRIAPSPQATETARMYAELIQKMHVPPGHPGDIEKIGELFLTATRQDEAWFPPEHVSQLPARLSPAEIQVLQMLPSHITQLRSVVGQRMLDLTEDAALDAALEYPLALARMSHQWATFARSFQLYSAHQLDTAAADLIARWAASDTMTLAQLERASREAQRIWRDDWDLQQVRQRDYLSAKDLWSGRQELWFIGGVAQPTEDFARLRRTTRWLLPMEYARIHRILDNWFLFGEYSSQVHFWSQATPLMQSAIHLPPDLPGSPFMTQLVGTRRQRLTVLQLQLGLKAYYLDQGRYPDSLNELLSWDERRGLIADPPDRNQWFYLPTGVTRNLHFQGWEIGDVPAEIPAGHPLIWSPGPRRRNLETFLHSSEEHGHTYYPVP
jgi:ABC-type transport system involved in multi-copper enzyme maturation permease subunit